MPTSDLTPSSFPYGAHGGGQEAILQELIGIANLTFNTTRIVTGTLETSGDNPELTAREAEFVLDEFERGIDGLNIALQIQLKRQRASQLGG